MTDFFCFPLEIRQIIYTYALVVGHAWPYLALERRHRYPPGLYEPPNVNLLGTCRSINIEASPILYSRNTFVLPNAADTLQFFAKSLHTPLRRTWTKDIELSFRPADLLDNDVDEINDWLEWGPEPGHGRVHAEYLTVTMLKCQEAESHLALKYQLTRRSWPRKVRFILDHLALDRLRLDFRGCMCYDECCQMEGAALCAFSPGFAKGTPAVVCVLMDARSNWYDFDLRLQQDLECASEFDCVCLCDKSNETRELFERWSDLRAKKVVSVEEGFKAMKPVIQSLKSAYNEQGIHHYSGKHFIEAKYVEKFEFEFEE
ncbi:hypothetical protein MMC13_000447 [Lambiella insularis]|nr:hypothetical protein [Lambiella insularis]